MPGHRYLMTSLFPAEKQYLSWNIENKINSLVSNLNTESKRKANWNIKGPFTCRQGQKKYPDPSSVDLPKCLD